MRRSPIRCRLFGHKNRGVHAEGGWPKPVFTIVSRCIRCGKADYLDMPSQITIHNSRNVESEAADG